MVRLKQDSKNQLRDLKREFQGEVEKRALIVEVNKELGNKMSIREGENLMKSGGGSVEKGEWKKVIEKVETLSEDRVSKSFF
jgi:hypothetical protein